MSEMNQMVGFNVIFTGFIKSINGVGNGFRQPIQHYTHLYDTVCKVVHGVYRVANFHTPINIEIKIEDQERLILRVKNESGYNSITFFKDGDIILMLELPNGDVIDGLYFSHNDVESENVAHYLLDLH